MSGIATPDSGPADAQLEPPSAPSAEVPVVASETGVAGSAGDVSLAAGAEEASAPAVVDDEAGIAGDVA
eukprot:13897568-Alexandrium_andersonii.AAC.1